MNEKNQRRHTRIRSLNLSHIFATEDGGTAMQGMGRTLNLSESGMLLETTFDIPMGDPLVITLGLEDELLEVRGHAVYSKPTGKGTTETGIEFTKIETEVQPKLKWFIHALSGKGTQDE